MMGLFEFLEQQKSVTDQVIQYRQGRKDAPESLTDRQRVGLILGILSTEATAGLIAVSTVTPNLPTQMGIVAGTAISMVVSGEALRRQNTES